MIDSLEEDIIQLLEYVQTLIERDGLTDDLKTLRNGLERMLIDNKSVGELFFGE